MSSSRLLEVQLQQLLFNLHEAVLVEDENRKVLLANPMFCQLFAGGAPAEKLLGMDCSNAAEEAKHLFKQPDIFVSRVEELLATRQVTIGDELELVNGMYLERDYIPIFLDQGQYKGHLWKYRDITENKNNELQRNSLIKKLHTSNVTLSEVNEELSSTNKTLHNTLEQLQKTQQQLITAQKMASIGTLAAGMAHEINNPVNYINGGIQVMKMLFEDTKQLLMAYQETDPIIAEQQPKQAAAIEEVKQEIDYDSLIDSFNNIEREVKKGVYRITNITQSLRQFTNANVKLEKAPNLAVSIIEEALSMLSDSEHIHFKKNYDTKLSIYCERSLMTQAVKNILQNAQEAITEEGLISIDIETIDGWLKIIVQDSGSGISEEHLQHIFDPFFSNKEVGEGAGMGLYTAYQIIEAHQGTIEVSSAEGKGTTFTIKLPIE